RCKWYGQTLGKTAPSGSDPGCAQPRDSRSLLTLLEVDIGCRHWKRCRLLTLHEPVMPELSRKDRHQSLVLTKPRCAPGATPSDQAAHGVPVEDAGSQDRFVGEQLRDVIRLPLSEKRGDIRRAIWLLRAIREAWWHHIGSPAAENV